VTVELGEATVDLTADQIKSVTELVRSDTAEGFACFYTFTRNMPLPRHAYDVVLDIYGEKAKEEERIAEDPDKVPQVRYINESFRGSIKTTTFTESFTAYQTGLHPERSNLFVQASDKSARAHASNVADVIEFNPMWRVFFPTVLPDKGKGWGGDGYWVVDTSRAEAWSSIRHGDPTLLGDSYGAAIVVGKHPTGVFVIDDINDDDNTDSPALLEDVNRILRETLFPMTEGARFCLFNQTPWNKGDALAVAKGTGVWKHRRTPVVRESANPELIEVRDDDGNVLWSFEGELTWPEKFDEHMIGVKYRESGFLGFCRMYLCRVDVQEGLRLKADWLRTYDPEKIDRSWVRVMGVDYASVSDARRSKKHDYFAMAIGAIIPWGGVVLEKGKVAHVSQGEALGLVESWAAENGCQLVCVETYGSGDEFYQLLMSKTSLTVWPDQGPRSKGWRYEKALGPAFEMGRAFVRDTVSDEFINTFRQQWIEWPACENDDALDAVYEMVVGASKVGSLALPSAAGMPGPTSRQRRDEIVNVNPWAFRRR
jgi:hypothetical protein